MKKRFKTGKALLAHGAGKAEIKAFFNELLEQSFNFHPDTRGREYAHGPLPGTRSLTDEEADEYDRLMVRAFGLCEQIGDDVYAIGIKEFEARLNQC